jgi:quinol monooxygenase YgiN
MLRHSSKRQAQALHYGLVRAVVVSVLFALATAGGSRIGIDLQESQMADIKSSKDQLVVTAFWEANRGEEDAVAAILSRFAPQAREEPGVERFVIHRSRAEPAQFFFYEVFADEAAFAAHQQTPHFKGLIAGEALPKLTKRERAQYTILC